MRVLLNQYGVMPKETVVQYIDKILGTTQRIPNYDEFMSKRDSKIIIVLKPEDILALVYAKEYLKKEIN